MIVSTRGQYALMMLIDLAEQGGKGPVNLKEISERRNISKKYLEQIVPALNSAGLLVTTRGYQGGYNLAKVPSDITVGEILRTTEAGLSSVACMDAGTTNCDKSAVCPTIPVWAGLSKVINDYLDGITLQDLIDQNKSLGEAGSVISCQ